MSELKNSTKLQNSITRAIEDLSDRVDAVNKDLDNLRTRYSPVMRAEVNDGPTAGAEVDARPPSASQVASELYKIFDKLQMSLNYINDMLDRCDV